MDVVEQFAQALTDDEAAEVLVALDLLDRRGRPLARGERLIPCGCWEHPVPHVAEAHPSCGWRVLWRCTGCGHVKG